MAWDLKAVHPAFKGMPTGTVFLSYQRAEIITMVMARVVTMVYCNPGDCDGDIPEPPNLREKYHHHPDSEVWDAGVTSRSMRTR